MITFVAGFVFSVLVGITTMFGYGNWPGYEPTGELPLPV